MATSGHESETINIEGLKASLQKFKETFIDIGELFRPVKSPSGTEGTTTRGAYNRSQWTGTVEGTDDVYDGMAVTYKVPVAGCILGTTLNINSKGEHPVLLNASTLLSTNYPVGSILMLVYDADATASVYVSNTSTAMTGCWKISNYDSNTTYTPLGLGFCHGTCPTEAATKAKTVAVSSFKLVENGIVSVMFTNAVTVASATLNINGTGAKPIYYKGAALAADVIQAGDIVTMQYSTQYHIISIERNIPDITRAVTDVSYDSSTGKLRKTVNGTATDVVSIVNSGFAVSNDETTGTDTFTVLGSATVAHDDTTGADVFTF